MVAERAKPSLLYLAAWAIGFMEGIHCLFGNMGGQIFLQAD
jgi:hypothetical protein